MAFDIDRYRNVKWKKGGREMPEIDCFGLVNEIRADLSLPLWPEFAGVTKDGGGLDREARKLMKSLERCAPEEGCGVACYSGSAVTHVAIVVRIGGDLYVAECNNHTNVTVMPIRRFERRFIKVEYWK